MYFPYLYARRNEQIALRECVDIIVSSGTIVPILEPVSLNTKELNKNLVAYQKARIPFIIIVNPIVGELRNEPNAVQAEIIPAVDPQARAFLGYNIINETSTKDLSDFLQKYPSHNVCMIHQQRHPNPQVLKDFDRFRRHIFIDGKVSMSYQRIFEEKERVLVSDGFPKRPRNADYGESPDELFGDLYFNYKHLKFDGFGDYTITGAGFRPSKGAAHAVALHLTYQNQSNQEIWIRHFVSDRVTGTVDTAGKFLEALNKLADHVTANFNVFNFSTACADYLDLHARQHFPGLGLAKKLSIRHHIEMVARLL